MNGFLSSPFHTSSPYFEDEMLVSLPFCLLISLFRCNQVISRSQVPFNIVASGSSEVFTRDNILNSIGKIQSQLIQENIPIFSFQRDITIILEQIIKYSYLDDVLSIESLVHEYLNLLRDYYFNIFTKRLSEAILDIEADSKSTSSSPSLSSAYCQSIWYAYLDVSQHCLLEFEVAKNSSIPNLPLCNSWYTQVSIDVYIVVGRVVTVIYKRHIIVDKQNLFTDL